MLSQLAYIAMDSSYMQHWKKSFTSTIPIHSSMNYCKWPFLGALLQLITIVCTIGNNNFCSHCYNLPNVCYRAPCTVFKCYYYGWFVSALLHLTTFNAILQLWTFACIIAIYNFCTIQIWFFLYTTAIHSFYMHYFNRQLLYVLLQYLLTVTSLKCSVAALFQ